ncbi:MAG: class D sortase [Terriglobales bacterium]
MRSSTRNTMRTWIEAGLWALAVVGLGVWFYAQWAAHNFQHDAARQLAQIQASGTAPTSARRAKAGEPLGRLSVPRLDLSVVVAEGDSATILRRAVGHVPQTALPGAAGNFVLAGHRDTFFRPLRETRAGDIIRFTTPQKTYTYQVEWTKVVAPSDLSVMAPEAASPAHFAQTLTLITCYPFYYIGPAPKRFVVRARVLAG